MQNLILMALISLGGSGQAGTISEPSWAMNNARATVQSLRDVAPRHSSVTGLVVGVSDGDTITVLTPEKRRIQVRLAEIDAPESSQAFGQRSKQVLSGLCFKKTATFVVRDYSYNRVVGRVSCDGMDAASYMVGKGYAWVFADFARDKSLFILQDAARQKRAGLWADPHPVEPKDYRRSKLRADGA